MFLGRYSMMGILRCFYPPTSFCWTSCLRERGRVAWKGLRRQRCRPRWRRFSQRSGRDRCCWEMLPPFFGEMLHDVLGIFLSMVSLVWWFFSLVGCLRLLRFPNAGAVLWLWRICKISTCPERLRYVASIRTVFAGYSAKLALSSSAKLAVFITWVNHGSGPTRQLNPRKKTWVVCENMRKLCGVGKVEIGRICHEQQGSTSQPFREATMEVTMEVSHRIHVRHIYLHFDDV